MRTVEEVHKRPEISAHTYPHDITTDTDEREEEDDEEDADDGCDPAEFDHLDAENPWLAREVREGTAHLEQVHRQEWVTLTHNLYADFKEIFSGV